MPEEVSVTFDLEVDLSDDAFVRSRYKQFYSVRSNYARENLEYVRESPVEGSFEVHFACEVEAIKSIKHISKNSPNSSKIHNYTLRAHVLRHVN